MLLDLTIIITMVFIAGLTAPIFGVSVSFALIASVLIGLLAL